MNRAVKENIMLSVFRTYHPPCSSHRSVGACDFGMLATPDGVARRRQHDVTLSQRRLFMHRLSSLGPGRLGQSSGAELRCKAQGKRLGLLG